jgi:hypothetical protein
MVITLENKPAHGYQYVSSMIQSWNKFCFTGGYIEVAVSLPGTNQVSGFVSVLRWIINILLISVDTPSIHHGQSCTVWLCCYRGWCAHVQL